MAALGAVAEPLAMFFPVVNEGVWHWAQPTLTKVARPLTERPSHTGSAAWSGRSVTKGRVTSSKASHPNQGSSFIAPNT